MYANEWKKWVRGTGRVLLGCVLLLSQSTWADQDPKASDKTSATPRLGANQTGEKQFSAAAAAKTQNHEVEGEASESAGAEEKSSGDGSHEGIKVHGNWTIVVRNSDGSLATHREFENSFQPYPSLSSFLSRTNSVGYWSIDLFTPNAGPFICQSPGSPAGTGGDCNITEVGAGNPSSTANFNNLVVAPNGNNLVLSGTAAISLNGTIAGVRTLVSYCPPTTPVSTGCWGNAYVFTQAILSTPIQVSTGQTVAVTVNISFS